MTAQLCTILDLALNETIDGLLAALTTTYPTDSTASFKALVTTCIHYVVAHRDLFALITQSNNPHPLTQLKAQLVTKVLAVEHLSRKNPQDYYDVVCSVSGVIGVITEWLDQENIPQAELILIVTNIISRI